MKKILLLLMLLATGISVGRAQNANRSGVFLELSGGPSIGNVLSVDYVNVNGSYSNPLFDDVCFKGGFDMNFSFGYRLALSNHWALGLSAGAEGNLKILSDVLTFPKAMLGGRWTSNDFNNGMSFYLQPQVGFALSIPMDTGIALPVGLDMGFNFTNHFYGGIDLQYYVVLNEGWHYKDVYQGNNHVGDALLEWNSHMTARIKFGYRF